MLSSRHQAHHLAVDQPVATLEVALAAQLVATLAVTPVAVATVHRSNPTLIKAIEPFEEC